MPSLYDPNAAKKPTDPSIDSDLLRKAKDLEINLSAASEQALTNQLKANQAQHWLQQNKNAIAAYNESVDEHGVFGAGLRSF